MEQEDKIVFKNGVAYKGDCLEVMPKHIEDKSVDFIFCDLPYGTTKCKWDTTIPLNWNVDGLDESKFIIDRYIKGITYKEAVKEWRLRRKPGLWQHYDRIVKNNAAIVLFAQTPFDKVLGESNLKMLRHEWIWEKTQATGHLNAKEMVMKAHENILIFYKKLPTYNPQKTTGHIRKVSKSYQRDICIKRREEKHGDDYLYGKEKSAPDYDSTERYPRSVITFPSDKQKSNLHQTQKPLDLVKYFIRTYTNKGDTILDNTAGSGTLGEACIEENRRFILIEKEQKHFNTIKERLKNNL